jgi:hypothetical protein
LKSQALCYNFTDEETEAQGLSGARAWLLSQTFLQF